MGVGVLAGQVCAKNETRQEKPCRNVNHCLMSSDNYRSKQMKLFSFFSGIYKISKFQNDVIKIINNVDPKIWPILKRCGLESKMLSNMENAFNMGASPYECADSLVLAFDATVKRGNADIEYVATTINQI
jgi:hypothetical protein